jgi:RHS repeat-associated protein
VATRPLLLSIPSGWHTYGFDQVKNATELFDSSGSISAIYDYAPFGEASLGFGSAGLFNPITFSSEIVDSCLGLIYYNWRFLNVLDGRWIRRDPVEIDNGADLYLFCKNKTIDINDLLGLSGECNPSSFLQGIKDPKQAWDIVKEKFPNDPVRQKMEIKKWEKALGLRRSTLTVKIKTLAKGCAKITKTCGSILILIVTPLEANADSERRFRVCGGICDSFA